VKSFTALPAGVDYQLPSVLPGVRRFASNLRLLAGTPPASFKNLQLKNAQARFGPERLLAFQIPQRIPESRLSV
jgi:hypothetical protein